MNSEGFLAMRADIEQTIIDNARRHSRLEAHAAAVSASLVFALRQNATNNIALLSGLYSKDNK